MIRVDKTESFIAEDVEERTYISVPETPGS